MSRIEIESFFNGTVNVVFDVIELDSEGITENKTQEKCFLFVIVVSWINDIFSFRVRLSGKIFTEKCIKSSESFDISQTDKTRIKLLFQVLMHFKQ